MAWNSFKSPALSQKHARNVCDRHTNLTKSHVNSAYYSIEISISVTTIMYQFI